MRPSHLYESGQSWESRLTLANVKGILAYEGETKHHPRNSRAAIAPSSFANDDASPELKLLTQTAVVTPPLLKRVAGQVQPDRAALGERNAQLAQAPGNLPRQRD